MVKSKIFECDFVHSVSGWFSGKGNAICLNDVVGSRDKNLNLIRFIVALAVIIGHLNYWIVDRNMKRFS